MEGTTAGKRSMELLDAIDRASAANDMLVTATLLLANCDQLRRVAGESATDGLCEILMRVHEDVASLISEL